MASAEDLRRWHDMTLKIAVPRSPADRQLVTQLQGEIYNAWLQQLAKERASEMLRSTGLTRQWVHTSQMPRSRRQRDDETIAEDYAHREESKR
jgi:hypothetical protein